MNILEVLKNNKILVSDGAMGTMLLQKGLTGGQCPEQFNVTHPEVIQSIHRDYFNAGADIVTTNSFGGTATRLKMHGLSGKVAEFSQAAVKNARLVCPEGKFVAGSIGPTGLVLEPLGEASRSDVTKMFEEQARALTDAGADVLFIETMMALEELECAMQAVKNVTSLPVSACMTFEKGPAGIRTQWGVDIKSFVTTA